MLEFEKGSNEKISIRLFVGCLITSELRMHLNQSIEWKHLNIINNKDLKTLTEVPYKSKNYLGIYTDKLEMMLSDLKNTQASVEQLLKKICPQYPIENAGFVIFSQVFIA